MTPQNRNYGHPSGRNNPSSGRQQHGGHYQSPELPTPVPLKYFSDKEKKRLRPELLDAEAQKNAKEFKDLKSAQLRRFYDDLKAIERKIMSGNQQENFERDRALITMFKAKAVYAEKRKVAPRAFTQFIFDHVASIQDVYDLKAFLKVFEAVVAFHKFYSPER